VLLILIQLNVHILSCSVLLILIQLNVHILSCSVLLILIQLNAHILSCSVLLILIQLNARILSCSVLLILIQLNAHILSCYVLLILIQLNAHILSCSVLLILIQLNAHILSCSVLLGNLFVKVPPRSLKEIYDRQVRWARLRRRIVLTTAILEPLLECTPSGIIGVAALASLRPSSWCGTHRIEMLALHMGLWIAADALLFRVVNGCYLSGAPTLGGAGRWMIAWGTREVGTAVMTLQGFMSNR
jgi:hypothetical protein